MPERTRRLSLVLPIAMIIAGAACSGSPTDAGPGSSNAAGSTATTAPVSTTTSTAVIASTPPPTDPPDTQRVVPYWMRDCPSPDSATEVGTCRVEAGEARLVPATADPVQEAMNALLAGPSPAERDAGLTTNIRSLASLAALTVEGDTATVDFNRYFETATTRPQVAQVVFTLTAVPAIKKVKFLIDHTTNGATGVPPVGRDDVAALVPAISVDTPTRASAVGRTLTITGTAKPAGTTINYRVESPAGPTAPSLAEGTATITPPKPGGRGPFSVTVTLPAGTTGPATLVLFQPNPTAGGPELTPVTIPLIVA